MLPVVCTIERERLRQRREFFVYVILIICNIFEVVEDVERVSVHTARPRRTGA